jgi:hypothetical protein
MASDKTTGLATPSRLALIERLKAADTSWDQSLLVVLARTAAGEIERLMEIADSLGKDLEGAIHNRFYDQADAYFEGRKDAERR